MQSAGHSTKASISACQRHHTPLESQLVLPWHILTAKARPCGWEWDQCHAQVIYESYEDILRSEDHLLEETCVGAAISTFIAAFKIKTLPYPSSVQWLANDRRQPRQTVGVPAVNWAAGPKVGNITVKTTSQHSSSDLFCHSTCTQRRSEGCIRESANISIKHL